jgi:hypothetical protein
VDNSLVLFQFVANVEVNADFALSDCAELQSEKLRVGNCGERTPGALQLLRVDFVLAHPR